MNSQMNVIMIIQPNVILIKGTLFDNIFYCYFIIYKLDYSGLMFLR